MRLHTLPTVVTVIGLLSAALVFAGSESGGGGNAVVCRNPDDSIRSAELLDLYEGRVRFDLNIAKGGAPLRDEIKRMIERIPARGGQTPERRREATEQAIRDFEAKIHFVTGDQTLGEFEDSYPVIVPRNCKIERLAFYDDRFDRVEILKEIWDHLSTTDQAALYSHEMIYQSLREATHGEETDSVRTRYYVAHFFSDLQLEPVEDGIPTEPGKSYICTFQEGAAETATHHTYAYVYASTDSTGKPGTVLQFLEINGFPVFSKKTAFFPVSLKVLAPEEGYGGGEYGTVKTVSKLASGDRVRMRWNTDGDNELKMSLDVADSFSPHKFNHLTTSYCRPYSAPAVSN